MVYILFSQPSGLYHQDDLKDGLIRLSIFLLAGLCGGLPALVWGLRALYGHYKSGGRISALVITLLLSDLLELLLSPYIVTKLLQDDHCWETSGTCHSLTSLWSASMFYGLYLQQVVVLEAVLYLIHPRSFGHGFFTPCSVITSIILFISFFLCEYFGATFLIVFSLPFILVITLTSCIVTCSSQNSATPYRTRKLSSTALAFVTFPLVLHIALNICAVVGYTMSWWMMNISLMSLRVIIDPLLCVLVYRKDLKAQTAEPSTDIELTYIQSSASLSKHTAQEV